MNNLLVFAQAVIAEYSKKENIIGAFVALIILVAIFSIPFIGPFLGLIIVAATLATLYQKYGNN